MSIWVLYGEVISGAESKCIGQTLILKQDFQKFSIIQILKIPKNLNHNFHKKINTPIFFKKNLILLEIYVQIFKKSGKFLKENNF